jgi:hypothetical protein
MNRIFSLSAIIVLLTVPSACHKCEQCTATQGEFGEVTREVCGRRALRNQLITELESDTISVGPWICE